MLTDPQMEIANQIKTILGERAIVEYREETNTIAICPPQLPGSWCSGFYLEHIRDKKWNEVIIPENIKVNLFEWLIDMEDDRYGGDKWCLKWMKEKYNIIDNCTKSYNVNLVQ